MTKILPTSLLILVILGTGYYFKHVWADFLFPPKPCTKPITYSIGEYDERFDISKGDFIKTISDAEVVWEKALGRELFRYSATSTFKVNLKYDYRQEATDERGTIDVAIKEDRGTYEVMLANYGNLRERYDRKKVIYDKHMRAYENGEYNTQEEVDELNEDARTLNALSSEINATAEELNDLAQRLNTKVGMYNSIGKSTGEEFSEGEYIRDDTGGRINVYQFETTAKLRRLLQHELGHALGLEHVEDPQAIMYRSNMSVNEKLTQDDLSELSAVCSSN